MHRSTISFVLLLALAIGSGLLMPDAAAARQPKRYQVTGKVLEVTADFIAVDKDGDRWEIGRGADTKITGNLKAGAKVTIEYRMTAATVDASGKAAQDDK